MSGSGSELRNNNEQIIKLMTQLRQQRNDMHFLIERQQQEKTTIENEIEKLSFKLTLLTKSLAQRLQAKDNYDKTIQEIEKNYTCLVEDSGKLLVSINHEVKQLEEIMDKKTETAGSITRDAELAPKSAFPMSVSNEQLRTIEEKTSSDNSSSHSETLIPTNPESENNKRQSIPENEENAPGETTSLNSNNSQEHREQRGTDSSKNSRRSSQNSSGKRSSDNNSGKRSSDNNSGKRSSDNNSGKRSSDNNSGKRCSDNSAKRNHSRENSSTNNTPKIKSGYDSDIELQSYREAYEKQHTG